MFRRFPVSSDSFQKENSDVDENARAADKEKCLGLYYRDIGKIVLRFYQLPRDDNGVAARALFEEGYHLLSKMAQSSVCQRGDVKALAELLHSIDPLADFAFKKMRRHDDDTVATERGERFSTTNVDERRHRSISRRSSSLHQKRKTSDTAWDIPFIRKR